MVLTAGLVSAPQAAGDLDDDKREADAAAEDAQGDLLAVNEKVGKATERVMKIRGQLPAANAKLQVAASAQSEADGLNRKALLELDQVEGDIHAAKSKLRKVEDEIDELRGDVGGFARRAYQMGRFTELELLLNAQSPADFTHRLEAIRIVSQSSGVALTQMSTNRADLGNLQIRLDALHGNAIEKNAVAETRLVAAQEAAARAASAKQEVDDLVAAEEDALATVTAKRAEVKAAYDKLAAEQARIQAEIAEAVRRAEQRAKREAARRAAAKREAARQAAAEREAAKRAAAKRAAAKRAKSGGSTKTPTKTKTKTKTPPKTSNPSGGGSTSKTPSGQWLFPISGGYIGSDAGWRFHPILHYRRCHAGADISAGTGTPIRASASGVVIMAGWNGGYGQFTTISHGNSVTTSYAHQSSIRVRTGQWVSRGQVIGYVGSTGLSTGPHLHYEIRISGAPYKPGAWFSSGSRIPVCV